MERSHWRQRQGLTGPEGRERGHIILKLKRKHHVWKRRKIDDKTVVATAGNRVWFGVEEKEDSVSDKGNSGDSCEDGDSGEDDESGEDEGSEEGGE